MTIPKFTIIISAFLTSVLSQMVDADSYHSSYSFNKLQASLCQTAETNRVMKFRYQLRQAKTHIRAIYSQISCDGETLLAVAKGNNSADIVHYLNHKTRGLGEQKLPKLAVN